MNKGGVQMHSICLLPRYLRQLQAGLALVFLLASVNFAQGPGQPSSTVPVIRVQSSLVLVDVIGQNPKNGLPIRNFQKEDFRIWDDGQEVSIASFDAGAHFNTRPVILWLVVI